MVDINIFGSSNNIATMYITFRFVMFINMYN